MKSRLGMQNERLSLCSPCCRLFFCGCLRSKTMILVVDTAGLCLDVMVAALRRSHFYGCPFVVDAAE